MNAWEMPEPQEEVANFACRCCRYVHCINLWGHTTGPDRSRTGFGEFRQRQRANDHRGIKLIICASKDIKALRTRAMTFLTKVGSFT